jgi:XTP/dITP diphosphohydrolase
MNTKHSLIFATNNLNKLREVQDIVTTGIKLLSLKEIDFSDTLPETSQTIEDNALQKAKYLYGRTHQNCFADDTGLEVEVLNGAPGVYSARYAGENASDNDNIKKLLKEMKGENNRKARFKTIIALIIDGKEYLFEGIVNGVIVTEPIGSAGFGYDPVFIPEGHSSTFAQMSLEDKNKISHRAMAFKKLAEYLGQF